MLVTAPPASLQWLLFPQHAANVIASGVALAVVCICCHSEVPQLCACQDRLLAKHWAPLRHGREVVRACYGGLDMHKANQQQHESQHCHHALTALQLPPAPIACTRYILATRQLPGVPDQLHAQAGLQPQGS